MLKYISFLCALQYIGIIHIVILKDDGMGIIVILKDGSMGIIVRG